MTTSDLAWLAAYLYYADLGTGFLTQAVGPFAESILAQNLATQFFFIRYGERGPHIRLRFKGDPRLLVEEVKPRLLAHFNRYFETHPSPRQEPAGAVEGDQAWLPNHSILFTAYEPELERYGGPVGIPIAEKQFQASSRAVLARLTESQAWDYDQALGAAIPLHLSLAWAMGLSQTETAQFFARLFKSWLVLTLDPAIGAAEADRLKRQNVVLNAFAENFSRQQSALSAYHAALWQGLEAGAEFEQAWLNQWRDDMQQVGNELKAAQADRLLLAPATFQSDLPNEAAEARRVLLFILGSYVHMTNNRLGILNRDEAYLNYLIQHSLEGG